MGFDVDLRHVTTMACLVFAACTQGPRLPPWDSDFIRLEETRANLALITQGWLKASPSMAGHPLVVVIEGDGAAWGRDGTPPSDPTPRSGTGARLAAALAQGRSLLYLARPCQYLSVEQTAHCSIHHWTDQRFGREPLTALNNLINQVQIKDRQIILIGFSGGGILAAELALKRRDVAGLITVAAPLDLKAWTEVHQISSLETIRPDGELLVALAMTDFFQCHLFGTNDQVVPINMTLRTARQLPPDTVRWVDGQEHDDDWLPIVTSALASMEKKIVATH